MSRTPVFVGIDTGGTFTDLIAVAGDRVLTHKILSTPHDPAEAVLRGLANLLDGRSADVVTYASTVATNALLERRGARVVLLTTAGFEDVLEIGRQHRPDLYALEPRKVEPLVPADRRLGVEERLLHDGSRLLPLSPATIAATVARVRRLRPESIAVCLLHAYANPEHELLLGEALAELAVPVTLSHQLVNEFREFERSSTTVLNAYVAPLMRRHLAHLEAHSGAARFRVLESNGGAIPASLAAQEAVRTVLSGPAGGVVGAWQVGRAVGATRLITFDMGGTSTDVSLLDGAPSRRTLWEIGGLPIQVPALDIHTVGAGGGSIAEIDAGGALQVGPRSAGADPGPACYGRGTLPTVTDANLVLGRLVAGAFLGGAMRLDVERAARALQPLARRLGADVEGAAEGVRRVVHASMERAVRRISVERGHDPRDFALVAFGGAAGQHACELASGLGIEQVLLPPHPGLLSAWGALAAASERDAVVTIRQVAPSPASLRRRLAPLRDRLRRALSDSEGKSASIEVEAHVDARYLGQSFELTVPFDDDVYERFHAAHQALYGNADRARPVEVVHLRLRARVAGVAPSLRIAAEARAMSAAYVAARWDGKTRRTRLLQRASLAPGEEVRGPALLCELSATTSVPPEWTARVHASGTLEVRRVA